MSVMICFGHFCEMHGPTSVMCTQSLSPKAAAVELPAVSIQNQHKTCASCGLMLPQQLSSGDNRRPQSMKTQWSANRTVISSQYPGSQARFRAIRQTCLRAFSSEHVFSDSSPIMFTDPAIGTAVIMSFQVEDGASRGQVRRYAIMLLGESESQVMRYWATFVPLLEEIATLIKTRATAHTNRQREAMAGHERFLRARQVQSKSLTTILDDDEIFVKLHHHFARILSIFS